MPNYLCEERCLLVARDRRLNLIRMRTYVHAKYLQEDFIPYMAKGSIGRVAVYRIVDWRVYIFIELIDAPGKQRDRYHKVFTVLRWYL